MAEDFQPYEPTARFDSVSALLGNHFKFVLADLPDLSFFVQQVVLPDVGGTPPKRGNPFTVIPELPDHLDFSPLTVHYVVDAKFQAYYSMFYWVRGYGFPNSYDDIVNFQESRKRQLASPKPTPRQMHTTHGTLQILIPDSDKILATVDFIDLFPIQVGQLSFDTTVSQPAVMTCQVQFAYVDYEITLNL
jgi:hypothetical protein